MGELVALLLGLLGAAFAFLATFAWRQYDAGSAQAPPPTPPWLPPGAPPTPRTPVFRIVSPQTPGEPFCWACMEPLRLHGEGGGCPKH